MENDSFGRRFTDLGVTSDFMTLMMELQQQSLMLRNLTEKVSGFPELTRKVDGLVAQMETISEEVDSIQSIQELVSWHERLWKLIASVCVLLFPAILGAVFWMWSQLSIVQSKQDMIEFKIKYMEKVNEQTIENSNLGKGGHKLSWNLRHFNNSRV